MGVTPVIQINERYSPSDLSKKFQKNRPYFRKISIDSFFDGLTLFCRYSGMAKYDMDTTDGREYVVAMHHDLGRKWSIFIQSTLEEGMKKTLNIIPKIDITESSIVFRFINPP